MDNFVTILTFTALIPIVIWNFFGIKTSKFLQSIYFLSILSICSDIIGTVCAFVFNSNLLVFHLYMILQTAMLINVWKYLKIEDVISDRLLNVSIGLSLVIYIFTVLYFGLIHSFTYNSIFNLTIILLLGLIYYYSLLKNDAEISFTEPKFIVVSAYILYALSSLVLEAFYFYVGPNASLVMLFTRQIFYLLFNLMVAFSFYIHYTNSKNKDHG